MSFKHNIFVFLLLAGFVTYELEAFNLFSSKDTIEENTKEVTKPKTTTTWTKILNKVFDILFNGFNHLVDPIHLPDLSVSQLTMLGPGLYGMSTMYRSCDITFQLDPITRDLELGICLSVDQLTLGGGVQARLLIINLENVMNFTLKNVNFEVKVTVPIKTGGPITVTRLSLEKFDSISLSNSSLLRFADPIINALLSVIKKIFVKIFNDVLPPLINGSLKFFPIWKLI